MATYFSPESDPRLFKCPCGQCDAIVNPHLVELLDTLRARVQRPIRVSSGPRCMEYNAKVGGHPNSAHLVGDAADILVTNSVDRWLVFNANFWTETPLFRRIGVYATHLHLDVSDKLLDNLVWVGGNP